MSTLLQSIDDLAIEVYRDFYIPLAVLEELSDGWQQRRPDGSIYFNPRGAEIAGTLKGDRVFVGRLKFYGVWDEDQRNDLKKMLQQSTGYVRARITCEGDRKARTLIANDGIVTIEG